VPLMQDLQKWAEQSQSSEDYKQLSLGTFEAAPRWLAKRKVNVKWTPLSLHQVIWNAKAQFVCECGRWVRAQQKRSDVQKVLQSLYQLTNSIQNQHSPHLQPFVEGEIQFVGYTDQDDKLQLCFFEEQDKRRNRSRLDYGLDFGFLRRKHVITDGFRAEIQVVPGRQHNGQHLVWNHMHYKSCVVVAGKPHVSLTRGSKWEWRHMDHDRNKVRCNQKTDIDHVFWWLNIIHQQAKDSGSHSPKWAHFLSARSNSDAYGWRADWGSRITKANASSARRPTAGHDCNVQTVWSKFRL